MKKYLTLKNLGWVITAVVVFLLGMGGFSKIAQTEEMMTNMTFFNLVPQMGWIGALEIVAVGLLAFPKTSMFGALGVSTMMAGAVALHFSYLGGVGIFMPILLGVLAWSAHCLRTYTVKA